MAPESTRIGVLTVSDRVSRGEYEDRGGPEVLAHLGRRLAPGWEPSSGRVPDESEQISAALRALADEEGCALILTTGGTGPAPRDVTPEATVEVCSRRLPGFGERMRAVSVDRVPTAILIRAVLAAPNPGRVMDWRDPSRWARIGGLRRERV